MRNTELLIAGISNETIFMGIIVMQAIVIFLLLIDSGKYGW